MKYPTKKFGELFEITSSKRVFKSEWVADGIPFYRAREVVSLSKDKKFKTPIFITNQMYEEYKDKYGVPKEGDLLATGVGTLGVCYRIKHDDKFYFKDGNIIWFKNISGVSPRYVELFFQSTNFKDQVEKYAGGATVKTFTIQTAKKIEIPLPPLAEQKKIVAKLEKLLAKVSEAKRLRAEAQEATSKLLPAELHKIFEEGKKKGWDQVFLSDIASEVTDGDHMPPPKSASGIPFITISNIDKVTTRIDFSKTFSVSSEYFENLKSNKKPKNGDVLYTVTGSFGIPVLVESDMDFCFQRHIALIRPATQTDSRWLYYILKSPFIYEQAVQLATGAAQKTVSLKSLRNFIVPKISLLEQRRFVARLDSLSEKTRQLQAHQKKTGEDLNALEQSILSQAFSGNFIK